MLLKPVLLCLDAFQFPTGWNSTQIELSLSELESCFNSQRDGILHEEGVAAGKQSAGFNSQRDGILQSAISGSATAVEFQFPTGWNST